VTLCCSCEQRQKAADSRSSLKDTRQSKSDQRAADKQEQPAANGHQPVTVYRQDEVSPDHREQETSLQRHHDDVVDDDDKHRPRSDPVVVSRVESKTPRDRVTVEQLEAQLPDRSDGSRNVGPGSVLSTIIIIRARIRWKNWIRIFGHGSI